MRMLTMLRDDRTRGSTVATASSITTMSSGSRRASTQPRRPRRVAGCAGMAMSASATRCLPPGEFLHGHREDDDDAEEDRLDARVDLQEIHGVGEDEEEDGGECDHLDAPYPALQADPGDDGRGDALEGELRVDDGLPRADLRGQRQARHRG